ncbi:ribosome maturation factor RimP [Marinisporobacter balticus]|uniref:Ribosome maturation factor RimP n=1 Tax=Marinisporobacter balticus TaxID=2018667 RepID=A0A4R2L0H5_9FIRM|nr:ribosome maturation factor RimP [Marinisporobacter balticus]TCO79904.1 ribosome maturation factor RimP [Marinisporobacter balticus]
MTKRRTIDIVEEMVVPFIDDTELELVDTEFVKEGPNWFLRVYIDKPSGVSLDDCQLVSKFLSEKLDEADPIEQNYYLEVSSPGLDRSLKKDKDFETYKGRMIDVYLYHALDGKKLIEGELIGIQDGSVVLKIHTDEELKIPREKISKVKLAITI